MLRSGFEPRDRLSWQAYRARFEVVLKIQVF